MERLIETYNCHTGDVWEIWKDERDDNTSYENGKNLITIFKKNGVKEGELIEYNDGEGFLRRTYSYGRTSIPCSCVKIV